jgi:hypothetical protein
MSDVYRVAGLSRADLAQLANEAASMGGGIEILDRATEPRFKKSGEEYLIRASRTGVLGLLSRAGVSIGVSTTLAVNPGTYRVGGLSREELTEKAERLNAHGGTRGALDIVDEAKGRHFEIDFFDHEAVPDVEFTVRADERALLDLLTDKRVLIVRVDDQSAPG